MSGDTIKVFVGCDPNNCDLEQMMVLDYSIHKHTQQPVDIVWMQLSRDENSVWFSDPAKKLGWRTEKWATPFSGFRWAIPEYCGFEGRAIYMDADVVVLCDLAELWQHPMAAGAMVAGKGGQYNARLCTCVWDNVEAKKHLPALTDLQADADGHQKLMQKLKDQPQLVQAYQDTTYNCVDGEDLPVDAIKIMHYSDMGTQFSHEISFPRLQAEGMTHWFDGAVMPHPREDLTELFRRYHAEALAAGYLPENYRHQAFGEFPKATQVNYSGNAVTRQKEQKSALSRGWKKIKDSLSGKKEGFSLDR